MGTQDTTLNLLQSSNGNVLMSLAEGGIQHFIAGARGNVGVKSGRYSFEVKVLQMVNTAEGAGSNTGAPKNVIRVGVSTAGSDLILGETEESICFDAGGSSVFNKTRTKGSQKMYRDDTVTVLLNLEKGSPNANTISLSKNGVRACQPVPLPEKLQGKTLFPHVSFKGASLHVNFGANPIAALPFKCRMVADASKSDAESVEEAAPEKGKYTELIPTSLPDEGSFQWLDTFLEQNKQYVELSDRKILDWAVKSGLRAPRQQGAKACNDKPDMNFQVRELDDASMRRAIYMVAPMQQRNYIVMEVQGNLVKSEREEVETDEPAPKVALEADEKKDFRVTGLHDLSSYSMSSSFTKFTVPEKEEGFDEIQYLWAKTGTKCHEFVKEWVLDRKATSRVEDLVPGKWFHQQVSAWQAAYKLWKSKVDDRNKAIAKKAANKAAKEAKKRAAAVKLAQDAAIKAAKEAKAAKDKEEGKETKEDVAEAERFLKEGAEKKEEEKKEEVKEEEKEEEEEEEEELLGVLSRQCYPVKVSN